MFLKYIYLIGSLFLLVTANAHSVQVQYCTSCNGDLRIWVEHWHGNENPSTTNMSISLDIGGVVTTQTSAPGGAVLGVPAQNLPGCSNPIVYVTGCPGQENTYNDWVYYDFTGIPAGVSSTFTILSGNTVFTQDGCGMFPVSVSFVINPNNGNIVTDQNACTGTLTDSIYLPSNTTWTNSNPSIGIPASGTGPIPPFVPNGPIGTTATISYTTDCTNGSFDYTIQNVPSQLMITGNNNDSTLINCFGEPFNFTDSSTIPMPDTIISWLWDFGDGASSTLQDTDHTYTSSGDYNVSLTVESSFGCSATTDFYVSVYPLPNANFNYTSACVGTSTEFTNNSSLTTSANTDSIASWIWDVNNDTQTDYTTKNTSHTYPSEGIYETKLIVSTLKGCTDTITTQVDVRPLPQVQFTFSDICMNETAGFMDNCSISNAVTSNVISSLDWDFGDGNSTWGSNVNHNYSFPGTYDIQLKATSNFGCKDSLTQQINVYDLPAANYGFSSACLGNSTSFTDSSVLNFPVNSDSIAFWNWDIDTDGATDFTAQNPVHIYATEGIYNSQLIVSTLHGCSDSVVIPVDVRPLPQVQFGGADICLNETAGFIDGSTISNAFTANTISNLTWDFGDGSTGSGTNVNHNFVAPGTYTVKLTATSDFGCEDSTSNSIDVYDLPVADFSFSEECFGIGTVFTDSSVLSTQVNNDSISSWSWDIDSDGLTDYTTENSSHTYPSEGIYSTQLIVSTLKGCSDTVVNQVSVWPLPQVQFGVADICLNETGGFTDASIISNAFTANTISNLNWDFGDGNTGSGTNINHNYTLPGTYTVKLVATSDFGCEDSTSTPINIYDLPTANFGFSEVCFGTNTIFTDSSILGTSVNNDSISSWSWDIDSDGLTDYTAENFSHIYPSEGTYNPQLIVNTQQGCSDTVALSVDVRPLPQVQFTLSDLCLDETAGFTDGSSISNMFTTNTISNLSWDFGDGNIDTGSNVNHNYSTAGTYSVKLVATSDFGCEDSMTNPINVYDMPIANFGFSSVCLGAITMFSDSSLLATSVNADSITSWSWDIDSDGSTDYTSENPGHIYPSEGIYNSQLIVNTQQGCSDTVTLSVDVRPLPQVQFTSSDLCLYETAGFTDGSTISNAFTTNTISNLNWNFGDGGTGTGSGINYNYSAPGTYTVKLITTSDFGCKDSITNSIHVYDKPVANFGFSAVCLGTNTMFSDSSILATSVNADSITSWIWDIDTDGLADYTTQNSSHVYQSEGIYNSQLIVSTQQGCSDTVAIPVDVRPLPQVQFTSSDLCLYETAGFTDGSTISNAFTTNTISSLNWSFGDGGTGTGSGINYNYTAPGTYAVQLVATSDFGCEDSTSSIIHVYDKPVANFGVSAVCLGVSTMFNDSSALATSVNNDSISSWIWDIDNDGLTDYATENTSHIYQSEGIYNSRLIVNTQQGCSDTILLSVDVRPLPQVQFSSSDLCLDETAVFTDGSSISNAFTTNTISNLNWSFGDGGTGTGSGTSHNYTVPGTYTVKLTATSDFGCEDSTSNMIHVYDMPVANFGFSEVCFGTSTVFTDSSVLVTSVNADSIVFWSWDINGNGLTDYTTENSSHIYPAEGIYNTELIVSTQQGCSDTVVIPVDVYPLPQVQFSLSDLCLNESADFTDGSTISNMFTTNTINNLDWDFGDGGTDSGQNVNHDYTSPGTYSVKLIATSGFGCQDSVSNSIHVYDLPVANFNYSEVCQGNNTLLTDNSVLGIPVNGDSIAAWTWDINNDGLTDYATKNTTHIFPSEGNYTTQLIVSTLQGCVDTIVIPVDVRPLPQVQFTFNDICMNETAVFTDGSSISNMFTTNTIGNLSWSFGDGATGVGSSVNHDYTAYGVYTVGLVATSDFGCQDSIENSINVYDVPVVEFISNKNIICDGTEIQFNDLSTVQDLTSMGMINSWDWYFHGAGISTDEQNPLVNYNIGSDGFFDVDLKVTNGYGCAGEQSLKNYVQVIAMPEARFSQSTDESDILDPTVIFFNESLNSDWYEWDFGDGTHSNTASPEHQYRSDIGRKYVIQLIVMDDLEVCMDTAYSQINIKEISLFYIPNTFTPNGDNYNNVWQPVFTAGYDPYDYKMTVYNRYGKLVWQSNDASIGWDGTYDGSDSQEGVYVWKAEFKERNSDKKHEETGFVTLLK